MYAPDKIELRYAITQHIAFEKKNETLFIYLWSMNLFLMFTLFPFSWRGLVADLKAYMSIRTKETNLILRFYSSLYFCRLFSLFFGWKNQKMKKKLKLMWKCIRFKIYMETFSQRYTSRLYLHLSPFISWPIL